MANYLDLTGLQSYHNKLKTYINTLHDAINTEIAKKQNKLTAGAGITINPETNVISFNGDSSIFIVAEELPSLETAKLDKIYVVLTPDNIAEDDEQNHYTEWYVKVDSFGTREWEKLGEFHGIDLSGYYTAEQTEQVIASMIEANENGFAYANNVYSKTTADATFVAIANNITETQIENMFKDE